MEVKRLICTSLFLLLFFGSAFASIAMPMGDARTILSNGLKTVAPSGEFTTQNFCLRQDDIISSKAISSKADLDSQSVYFVKGSLQNISDVTIKYEESNSILKYSKVRVLSVRAKLVCEPTALELDSVLSDFDIEKYEFDISAQDYCADAQPCCVVVLERGEGSCGSAYSSQSSNSLIAVGIVFGIPILIILVFLWLIFKHRNNSIELESLQKTLLIPMYAVSALLLLILVFVIFDFIGAVMSKGISVIQFSSLIAFLPMLIIISIPFVIRFVSSKILNLKSNMNQKLLFQRIIVIIYLVLVVVYFFSFLITILMAMAPIY